MEYLATVEARMKTVQEIQHDLADLRELNPHAWEEIVTHDEYRLGALADPPNVILDLGANVGIFTAYAKCVFPKARIVAIEPEEENYRTLCRMVAGLPEVTALQMAVGRGQIWFRRGTTKGGHGFLSVSIGRASDELCRKCEPVDVSSAMPDAILADLHLRPEDRLFVKIDIEGGESVFLDDEPSMKALQRANVLAMELHPWASLSEDIPAIRFAMFHWLESFLPTHYVEFTLHESGGMAWMRKR